MPMLRLTCCSTTGDITYRSSTTTTAQRHTDRGQLFLINRLETACEPSDATLRLRAWSAVRRDTHACTPTLRWTLHWWDTHQIPTNIPCFDVLLTIQNLTHVDPEQTKSLATSATNSIRIQHHLYLLKDDNSETFDRPLAVNIQSLERKHPSTDLAQDHV